METRQILIKILTQLQDKGIKAAQQSVKNLTTNLQKAVKTQQQQGLSQAQIRRLQSRLNKAVTQELKEQLVGRRRLITLSNKLTKTLSQEAQITGRLAGFLGRLKGAFQRVGASSGVFRAGLSRVQSGLMRVDKAVRFAAGGFGFFRTVYGRVIQGLLTVTAFQTAIRGIEAVVDAVVGGNAKMQTAMAQFTALSGGSVEMAETFIDVLKQLSVQTGSAFDQLLEGARRLPSKVGENVAAFEQLTKIAIVLSRIDPAQGLEGAFFALTNAMEGGAQGLRSLIQRFEIGTVKEFNEALDETGNTVDALTILLQNQGIEVDSFLDSTQGVLPVVTGAIKAMANEFLRLAGEKTIAAITDDLAKLRDWLQENQAKIQGLALAIGDRLAGAFQMLKTFISEVILGGRELSASNMFDALLNGAVAFTEFLATALVQLLSFLSDVASAIASILNAVFGLFGGSGQADAAKTVESVGKAAKQSASDTINLKKAADDTSDSLEKVATASESVGEKLAKNVTMSADAAVGSLLNIGKMGKETMERFVGGILDSVSGGDLQKVGDAVLSSVLNLEAQEIAQEQSVKNIEKWVNEAAKEVEAARDRLALFDASSADIPERFTRARKRQLEQEIRAAESEEDRRKAALDNAKEQLSLTKENLQAQREILKLVESRLSKESGGDGIDKSFTPGTVDTGAFKADVEEFRAQFADRLEPSVERIKASFAEIGEFVRGFVGADPAGQISEMFEKGQQLKDAVSSIGSKLMEIAGGVKNIFTSASETWSGLPDPLKKTLLVAFGLLLVPGGGTLVGLTLSLGFKIAGLALSATAPILKWLVGGAAGAISLPALALVGATLVLGAQIWFGREELSKWISGERSLELGVILLSAAEGGINKVLEGAGFEGVEIAKPIAENFDTAKQVIDEANISGHIIGAISPTAGLLHQALEPAAESFFSWASGINDELVGNSIFPDMLNAIVGLMTNMPNRLLEPLTLLRETILGEMSMIREQWVADWTLMAQVTLQTLQLMAVAREAALNMGSILGSLGINQSLAGLGGGNFPEKLELNLDAEATKKLMEQGVYSGFIELTK